MASDDMVLPALRRRLEAYTTDKETLPSFRRWFLVEVLGPIEDLTSDRTVIDFVYRIGLRLFEADDGIWTEVELKREFRRLLREIALEAPARAAS